MFGLPGSTEIRKPVHKRLLYQRFPDELGGEKKERFDADISRIVITNEISEASVNIRSTEKIKSIFVVQIELKNKEFSDRNIILISKLFGQNLLMVLHYCGEYQLAIYETKILKSEWKNEINLNIKGLDLSSVWESFVTEVSGITATEEYSLAEQIEIEDEKNRLKKKIAEMESNARRETQSKKKFDMFQKVQALKKELEQMGGT